MNRDARIAERRHFLSRRGLLRVGGIGALNLFLPELLQAGASGRPRGPDKSCLFIFQYGGPSHIDTLDPKPQAPAEIRGPYRPIATRVPGLCFGELLPRLASVADKLCVIRSLSHRQGQHEEAINSSLSGQSRPEASAPFFGSVVAKVRPAPGDLPSYVWIQDLDSDRRRYRSGGFLGEAYSPMRVGRDYESAADPGFRMTAFDPPAEVTAQRLDRRRRLLTQLEPAASLPTAEPAAAMRRFQERALDLIGGPEARQAFALEREPVAVRDRYGRHPLGQNLLLARRLIEAGVRLVTVNAWAGTAPGERGRRYLHSWDMHGNFDPGQPLGNIFGTGSLGLGFVLPRFDEAVSVLIEDLHQRGLLESTVVVMIGEFGRKPTIYRQGRDHWPACYSGIVAGGGFRGGMTYGVSDPKGAFVRDLPVAPEDFGATLLHALGVPADTRLARDGFTKPASTAAAIRDLFH